MTPELQLIVSLIEDLIPVGWAFIGGYGIGACVTLRKWIRTSEIAEQSAADCKRAK